jgi:hypothetical protein
VPIALIRGFRLHGRIWFFGLLASGLLCIFAGIYVGELHSSHGWEVAVTVFGSNMTIPAHRCNHTFCPVTWTAYNRRRCIGLTLQSSPEARLNEREKAQSVTPLCNVQPKSSKGLTIVHMGQLLRIAQESACQSFTVVCVNGSIGNALRGIRGSLIRAPLSGEVGLLIRKASPCHHRADVANCQRKGLRLTFWLLRETTHEVCVTFTRSPKKPIVAKLQKTETARRAVNVG